MSKRLDIPLRERLIKQEEEVSRTTIEGMALALTASYAMEVEKASIERSVCESAITVRDGIIDAQRKRLRAQNSILPIFRGIRANREPEIKFGATPSIWATGGGEVWTVSTGTLLPERELDKDGTLIYGWRVRLQGADRFYVDSHADAAKSYANSKVAILRVVHREGSDERELEEVFTVNPSNGEIYDQGYGIVDDDGTLLHIQGILQAAQHELS